LDAPSLVLNLLFFSLFSDLQLLHLHTVPTFVCYYLYLEAHAPLNFAPGIMRQYQEINCCARKTNSSFVATSSFFFEVNSLHVFKVHAMDYLTNIPPLPNVLGMETSDPLVQFYWIWQI